MALARSGAAAPPAYPRAVLLNPGPGLGVGTACLAGGRSPGTPATLVLCSSPAAAMPRASSEPAHPVAPATHTFNDMAASLP